MNRVYLDNSATTKLSETVKKAMLEAFDFYGNPSSLHEEGRRAKQRIEKARVDIARLINARPSEIVFTSGGTESNNTVINIVADIIGKNDSRTEIIVSMIEHPSVLEAAKKLEREGVMVHYLPVDAGGRVKIAELKKIISEKTALVSVMLANNEIGTVQDVKQIAAIAHEYGALMHSDIVQAIGKIKVDVANLGLDYASMSAHKIGGPKGIGALSVRSGAPFNSFLIGGHQENGQRAGTYNTLSIIGFGQAAKDACKNLEDYYSKIEPIKNKLREEIIQQISNAVVNGNQNFSLPNILNISFAGAEGESILLALDHFGIAVSTGSACASGDAKPSHVLMAIKANPELAHGSIRFSFGLDNTPEDVEKVMACLPKIVKNLREISTVGV